MKDVYLLFPGQGAQYVGMNKDLDQQYFEKASKVLNFDLKSLCLEGPEEKLKLTKYTQPALVAHSYTLFDKLKTVLSKKGFHIKAVLGHSVGEYSALAAAGSIKFEDAIKAVHNRGLFMQSATPQGVGKMYALVRVPLEMIEKACAFASSDQSKVMIANYNEPLQTVISGHAQACDKAVAYIKENFEQKHMAIELKVSAPFHSSLMKKAAQQMKDFFTTIEFEKNEIPYFANIDAKLYENSAPDQIKKRLIEQIDGNVRWFQSIEQIPNDSICIEVGPGKVLTGLNKKINKSLKTFRLDQEDSFKKCEEFLDECSL